MAAPRRLEEAHRRHPGAAGVAGGCGADHHDLTGGKRDVDLVRVAEQTAQPAQHRPERRDVGDADEAQRTVERPTDGPCHEQGAEREVPGVADEHRWSLIRNVLEAAEDRCPPNGGEPGRAAHGMDVAAPIIDIEVHVARRERDDHAVVLRQFGRAVWRLDRRNASSGHQATLLRIGCSWGWKCETAVQAYSASITCGVVQAGATPSALAASDPSASRPRPSSSAT